MIRLRSSLASSTTSLVSSQAAGASLKPANLGAEAAVTGVLVPAARLPSILPSQRSEAMGPMKPSRPRHDSPLMLPWSGAVAQGRNQLTQPAQGEYVH